jgi:hypothetical protein
LKDQVICERAFLSGCDLIMVEREGIFFHALRGFKEGLLSGVFDTPDRMQHMFWRYLDTWIKAIPYITRPKLRLLAK